MLTAANPLPQLTIDVPIDAALFEGHDVLCECACLVGEDVVDLPQLLIERGGPGLGGGVLLGVVHLQVPIDEVTLAEANHFHAVKEKGIVLRP